MNLITKIHVNLCLLSYSWLTRTVLSRLLKKAILMALWAKAITCHKAGKNIISVNTVILSNFSSCSSYLRGEKTREIRVNPWLIFRAFLWLKTPRNQRNPRLINDLRACKALYNCRETITDVMGSLQIRLFMQNKPKYLKDQMNVTTFITKNYGNKSRLRPPEKQSQTNPNKANYKKAKMNVNKVLTKDYKNNSNWTLGENKANTNPIKPNFTPRNGKKGKTLMVRENERTPQKCLQKTNKKITTLIVIRCLQLALVKGIIRPVMSKTAGTLRLSKWQT